MTQADCVLSTPPTNTPIDTHRRRFLAIAAGASVASVGALTASAMPAGAQDTACEADPIFEVIDAPRSSRRFRRRNGRNKAPSRSRRSNRGLRNPGSKHDRAGHLR